MANQSNLKLWLALGGLVALLALAILVAVAVLTVKHDDVDVTCKIGGDGTGWCAFTSDQSGVGSICGHVRAHPRNDPSKTYAKSARFCSGEVESGKRVEVPVVIDGAKDACVRFGDGTPGVVDHGCGFEFVTQ